MRRFSKTKKVAPLPVRQVNVKDQDALKSTDKNMLTSKLSNNLKSKKVKINS